MEILAENFSQNLDFVIQSVKSADFITLDTEFSGLNVSEDDMTHGMDQVEDRY